MADRSVRYPQELRERVVRLVAESRPDHATELRQLRAENRELRRANEILKAAGFFASMPA